MLTVDAYAREIKNCHKSKEGYMSPLKLGYFDAGYLPAYFQRDYIG